MKSMTGYGVISHNLSDCSIEVSFQSVNNRFLEIRIQQPHFYTSLENKIKNIVKKHFVRGSIDINIQRTPAVPNKKMNINYNTGQALKWKNIHKKMANILKVENNVNLLDLIRQPGVLNVEQTLVVSAKEKQVIIQLIHKAISLCEKERIREGQFLKKEFQKYFKDLSYCVKNITKHSFRQKNRMQKDLKNKLIQYKEVIEPQKQAQEIILLINRMNVNEEISRMTAHIKACRSLLLSKKQVGKQMNFYLQEMGREMNTIGSKSQDFKLTQTVVVGKSIIESMREQIQNVE